MGDDETEYSKEDYDDWTVTMHDAAKTWKAPDSLYHYTTIDGLWGILGKGRLWGTHVAFLNDAQELEYGIEAAIKTLQDRGDDLPSSGLDQGSEDPELGNGRLLRGVGDFIERHREMFKPALAPFVTCMSSSEDQLSQWRGYGKAGGYAIRFDLQALKNELHHVDEDGQVLGGIGPSLERVRYRGAFEEEIVTMGVAFIDAAAAIERDNDTEEAQEEARMTAYVDIFSKVLDIAPRIKHKKFAEEREYRIITTGVEQFYSPSRIGLIPRVLVHFDPGAIKEVMVGPGEFSELRKMSIERYLDRNRDRYPDVKVTESEVPYRDL